MWPILVHFCNSCQFNTPVSYSATVFTQPHDCSHCGRGSVGADVQGRHEDMSQHPQDELAQLFARNMNFSQPLPDLCSTPDKQFMMQQPPAPHITYASAHYTGTAHLQPSGPVQPAQPDTRADSPMGFATETAADIETLLRRNDVDPVALVPSQVKLFADANPDQRLRLLELWRISPPQYHDIADRATDVWPLTSMAKEEEMARLRYERVMREQQRQEVHAEVEPYMAAAYALQQRSDPVYALGARSRSAPEYSEAVQAMACNYGAFEHARYMEHDVPSYVSLHGNADDDMVM